MQQQRAEKVRNDIIRLCHSGLDARNLRLEIIKRLRKIIPFDVFFFTLADPATLLFTGAIVDPILERVTPAFLENEFLQSDVNKFSWLARSNTPVGGLMQATRYDTMQSLRYNEILAPLALGDELRVALLTGGVCWGFMCLHRDRLSPVFTGSEVAFISQLAPHMAEGLRKALLLKSSMQPDSKASDEPGLLLLAEDLTVMATTPAAERWISEIAETTRPGERSLNHPLPFAVISVVARLKALEQGFDKSGTGTGALEGDVTPKVRLRTASGRWLVLHAARLTGQNPQQSIAVIFEVARPVEIAPLIIQAYELSRREGEIMQCVLHAMSTLEIAEKYHISSNTVQDHLKAVFLKVGVNSRRELVGQIFNQHYQPRIVAGSPQNINGWFN